MSGEKRALWGVRGISNDLANQVAAAAKARGMMLGEWVTLALEAALERENIPAPAGHDIDLLARVLQLEERVRQLDKAHGTELANIHTRVAALEAPTGETGPVSEAGAAKERPSIPEPPGGFD